jgi:hypothetical protein
MTDERKFDCIELEAALQEDSPARMAALEAHTDVCAACHAELVLWREISAAARTMHKEWDSPGLWPRIARGLESEAPRPRGWRAWFGEGGPVLRWQIALATVAILMMTVTTAWVVRHRAPARGRFTVSQPDNKHLLTDQAVQEVEQAEKAYEQSIDKLAKLAEPKLENASNPVMVNYREKLQLLDAAISDCRANLDKNNANAYLRKELASFYQEKQKTLEEVLRED